MGRKRDLAAMILAFFEESELPVATTVLGIVKAIVAKRQPKPKAKAKAKPVTVEKPHATGPSEAPLPATAAPTGKAPAAEAKGPRRRKPAPETAAPAAAAPAKEVDLKLPGIGPATVGE
jgi:hypothetical protein